MKRINSLPPFIANQIAAGEVIERPASVVKELLENAFDAQASQIHIEIGFGGLNLIRVSDNGTGIYPQDLGLAIAPHATSKISQLTDLYAIETMGFRGEALASISSVSRVIIRSKVAAEAQAMMLEAVNEELTYKPCARTQGTTIEVHDIFFNAPVRKKFLKSERIEFQAIDMMAKRFAMSAPAVGMSLTHHGKVQWQVNPAICEQSMRARILKLLGKKFLDSAHYLDVDHGGMHLYGWLGGADYQRSQNDGVWIYLNNRMIKDKLLMHAIKQAYAPLLHPGRYPACLLYLNIDPAEVDVNVHPTKHEVRFQQSRFVHDFILSQISQVLAPAPTAQAASLDCFENVITGEHDIVDTMRESIYPSIARPHRTTISSPSALIATDALKSQRAMIERAKNSIEPFSLRQLSQSFQVISIDPQFSLIMHGENLYVADMTALKKHWFSIGFNLSALPWPSRPLLVPVYYQDASMDFERASLSFAALRQLGLQVDKTAGDQLIVRSVPICAQQLEIKAFLQAVFLRELSSVDDVKLTLEAFCSKDPTMISVAEEKEFRVYLQDCFEDLLAEGKWIKSLSAQYCQAFLYA